MNAVVKEVNSREVMWTLNAKNKCGSQDLFKRHLLNFQDYCHNEEKIHYDEIGTKQMTDPLLLNRMVYFYKINNMATTSIIRLLNWIHRGVQNRGYLRFCADMNEKTFEDFNHALEAITNKYSDWVSDLSTQKNGKRKKNVRNGKENIQFLLKFKALERMLIVHEATRYLVNKAINLQKEAHYKVKISKKATGQVSKEKYCKSAASNIRKSMNYIQAAVIQEISFYNCPRSFNWTILKYYANAKAQDKSFSSLTFLSQRNRYRLFIPIYGTSVINSADKDLRCLKNSNASDTVNVDVELPEHLTPLIKKLIGIRADYIKMDLVHYGKVDGDSFDILLPWRSIRAKDVKDPLKFKTRKLCIAEESKLSDSFLSMTYVAYLNVLPDENQHGINIHAMRHLAAETHLEKNSGDYIGAAAILNDDIEQIIKTYGNRDRAAAMRRVSQESNAISFF
jgi:hypothetical protein